jgi:hypothetical protein
VERQIVERNELSEAVQVGYTRDEELDFEAVVFAFANGESLELQGSLVSEEPYCVSSNYRGAAYDSLVSWSAHDSRLVLRLTEEAAVNMEHPNVLVVEAPDGELPAMVPHIERILGMPPTDE